MLRMSRKSPAIMMVLAMIVFVSQASGQGGSDSTGQANSPGQSGSGDELDLREANVTNVVFETAGGNQYDFDVTLYHDDAGEEGYANWWQVETLDGEQLGRRELLHAHGTREFTRSQRIQIPAGVMRIVVRGHDQVHGYGGQAMIVDLESGETEAVRQGPEPQDFSDR